jgi:hypothetical protein
VLAIEFCGGTVRRNFWSGRREKVFLSARRQRKRNARKAPRRISALQRSAQRLYGNWRKGTSVAETGLDGRNLLELPSTLGPTEILISEQFEEKSRSLPATPSGTQTPRTPIRKRRGWVRDDNHHSGVKRG